MDDRYSKFYFPDALSGAWFTAFTVPSGLLFAYSRTLREQPSGASIRSKYSPWKEYPPRRERARHLFLAVSMIYRATLPIGLSAYDLLVVLIAGDLANLMCAVGRDNNSPFRQRRMKRAQTHDFHRHVVDFTLENLSAATTADQSIKFPSKRAALKSKR